MKKLSSFLFVGTTLFISACAAPPLQYYTLSGIESNPHAIQNSTLNKIAIDHSLNNEKIVYISRISVPDYLNTTDILIRQGVNLKHSNLGRMSSTFSVGATEFLTQRIAQQRNDLLVTNQTQVTPPDYQIIINISRFDVAKLPTDSSSQKVKNGTLTVEANWSIIPVNEKIPVYREKGAFTVQGSLASDKDVIHLEQQALSILATQINIHPLY